MESPSQIDQIVRVTRGNGQNLNYGYVEVLIFMNSFTFPHCTLTVSFVKDSVIIYGNNFF